MDIIKMVIEDEGPETTDMVCGPGILLTTFSADGGVMDPLKAGKMIDSLVNDYIFEHPEVSYQEALKKILDKHPDLKAAYAKGVPFPNHDLPADSQKLPNDNPKRGLDFYLSSDEDVRAEVDSRVKKYMAKNTALDYEQAMQELFAANPELKERYSRS